MSKFPDVNSPDDLLSVECPKCGNVLKWNTELSDPALYPMDATADAYCCGRIIHAYINSIHLYDTSEGE
jgi:hypothetical protein